MQENPGAIASLESSVTRLTAEVSALTREVRESHRDTRAELGRLDERVTAMEIAHSRAQGREEARLKAEREVEAEREARLKAERELEQAEPVSVMSSLWLKVIAGLLTLIATFVGGSQVHL